MVSPTPNKGYTYPAHGGAVNAWDTPLNTNFDQIDLNVGGVYPMTLISTATTVTYNSSNATFSSTVATLTLPAANAQNLTYVLSGTKTQNVSLVFPGNVGGLYDIWNNSTDAFNLTALTTVATSSGVIIPSGYRMLVASDKTNMKEADTFIQSIIGTSGTKLTYADGANTYSGNSSFTGIINHSGAETFTGSVTLSSNFSAVRIVGSVLATSASQVTGTSSNTVVTPQVQGFHESAVAAWVKFTGATGAIVDSYNITSVSRSSTGFYTVTFTAAMANSNYVVSINTLDSQTLAHTVTTQSTNSFGARVTTTGGTNTDATSVYIQVAGTR